MYKVYLSPATKGKNITNNDFEVFRMNQIVDVVEQVLLSSGEYAVYRNVLIMDNDEIIKDSNEVKPDIHVALQFNFDEKIGPKSYVKVGSEVANGIGKESYKEIMKIYYNKEIDNGLIYDDKIAEINKVNSPGILITLGSKYDKNDFQWVLANTDNIGNAIAKGIIKGFTLKPC